MFSHLLASYLNRQIDTLLTGSNYPAINSGDVRALQIPVPEYGEQTAIATVLSGHGRRTIGTGSPPRQDARPQAGDDAGTTDRKNKDRMMIRTLRIQGFKSIHSESIKLGG